MLESSAPISTGSRARTLTLFSGGDSGRDGDGEFSSFSSLSLRSVSTVHMSNGIIAPQARAVNASGKRESIRWRHTQSHTGGGCVAWQHQETTDWWLLNSSLHQGCFRCGSHGVGGKRTPALSKSASSTRMGASARHARVSAMPIGHLTS